MLKVEIEVYSLQKDFGASRFHTQKNNPPTLLYSLL